MSEGVMLGDKQSAVIVYAAAKRDAFMRAWFMTRMPAALPRHYLYQPSANERRRLPPANSTPFSVICQENTTSATNKRVDATSRKDTFTPMPLIDARAEGVLS